MSSFLGGGGGGGSGLTIGTTTVTGGTSGYVLTDNAGVLGNVPAGGGPARTVLAGDTSYYVATTGNDSNSGSIGSPWLTLQHAMNFIAAMIDFAGFKITVFIGAGTFAGFGVKSLVGGGVLQFTGAGSGSTTIGNGPNDGVYNFGGCFVSNIVSISTPIYVDAVTLNATFGAGNVDTGGCIAAYSPSNLNLGDFAAGTCDVVITGSGAPSGQSYAFVSTLSVLNVQGTSGLVFQGNSLTLQAGIYIVGNSYFVYFGSATFTGVPDTFTSAFFLSEANSDINTFLISPGVPSVLVVSGGGFA